MVNGESNVSSDSPKRRPPSIRLNAAPQSRSSPAYRPPLPGRFLLNSGFPVGIGSTCSLQLSWQAYGDGGTPAALAVTLGRS